MQNKSQRNPQTPKRKLWFLAHSRLLQQQLKKTFFLELPQMFHAGVTLPRHCRLIYSQKSNKFRLPMYTKYKDWGQYISHLTWQFFTCEDIKSWIFHTLTGTGVFQIVGYTRLCSYSHLCCLSLMDTPCILIKRQSTLGFQTTSNFFPIYCKLQKLFHKINNLFVVDRLQVKII